MGHRYARRIRQGLIGAGRLLATLRRDELGSEVISFVLVLPIFLALLWTSYEVWQLMSLRAALRTTVAQTARYITAYAALDPTLRDRPGYPYPNICQEVRAIVDDSLGRYRGILGNPLDQAVITYYWVKDPLDPRWDGNVDEVQDCELFLSGLGITSHTHFGVKVHVSVDWRTVLFGFNGTSQRSYKLVLEDRAAGAITALPDCSSCITGGSAEIRSCTGDNCDVYVCWTLDTSQCDFIPKIELWQGTQGPLLIENNPDTNPCGTARLHVPAGQVSHVTIKAVGRQRTLCTFDVAINRP